MTPQERQLIESLVQRLTQAAPQAGPRDPEAEAFIQQRFRSLPGAAYYMTQTLLVQERALREAEARLGGGGGSFMPPTPGHGGYGQRQQYAPRQGGFGGGGVGGFLAGAGQMALGVGGGILVADAVMALGQELFGGGGFGGGDSYAQGYEQGFDRGFDDGQDRGDDPQDDQGGWDDGGSDDSTGDW